MWYSGQIDQNSGDWGSNPWRTMETYEEDGSGKLLIAHLAYIENAVMFGINLQPLDGVQ